MNEVTFISSCCGDVNFPQTLAMMATVALHFPESELLMYVHAARD